MIYREVGRKPPTAGSHRRDSAGAQRDTGEQEGVVSSRPRGDTPRGVTPTRGSPIPTAHITRDTPGDNHHSAGLPQAAIENAMGELRDVMAQYTSCADPTESAARKERLRQAEEQGEIEETAIQMVRASLATLPDESPLEEVPEPAERDSTERVPARQRLGPPPSAKLRLGPAPSTAITKKKPGRPPGPKKIPASPLLLTGTSSRKRKVQTKPPVCRRKLHTSKDTESPRRIGSQS
ncbi:unnamed protein product, partial [Brassica rapa subsp. narinosa]